MLPFLILISILLITFLLLFVWAKNRAPEGPNRFGTVAPSVNFVDASIRFFTNYFNFRERASRSEFWYAMLMYVAVCFFCGVFGLSDELFSIWLIGTLIPFWSVSARRLHDTNRSGWLQIVSWIAPIGMIIGIYWFSESPRD